MTEMTEMIKLFEEYTEEEATNRLSDFLKCHDAPQELKNKLPDEAASLAHRVSVSTDIAITKEDLGIAHVAKNKEILIYALKYTLESLESELETLELM